MALGVDDPQRQSSPAEPRRAQGRRPPGLERLGRDPDDGALSRCHAAAGPGRGQAARGAAVSRAAIPAGPAEPRQARALPRPGRRAGLSLAQQGWRHRRFLDRLGRTWRRRHPVRLAGAGLFAAQAPGARRRATGSDDRAGRRWRARRGQHLRGVARRLEA